MRRAAQPPKLPQVLIVSALRDLHASGVAARLKANHGVEPHVIDINDALVSGGVTWSTSGVNALRTREGRRIDPQDMDAVWWRRINTPQRDPSGVIEESDKRFLSAEWKASYLGLAETRFDCPILNPLAKNQRADNKCVQLQAAQDVGLAVPTSCITQDWEDLCNFVQSLNGDYFVAKKLHGIHMHPTQTLRLQLKDLSPEALRTCPTLFQACVPGERHLRLTVFGQEVHGAIIESPDLDWRASDAVRYKPAVLSEDFKAQVLALMAQLGLQVAVHDFKFDGQTPVYLETNPQGQFLFVEAMGGGALLDPFCAYLAQMAKTHFDKRLAGQIGETIAVPA
ncbi:MAG: hypothetical protein AAGD04_15230 [Pseudomonadota bacterium]